MLILSFHLLIYLGLDRQGQTRSKTSMQSVSYNTLYGRSVFNMQLLHKSMEVIKKNMELGLIFLLYMFKSDTDDERFKLKSIWNTDRHQRIDFTIGEDTREHEKALVFNDLGMRTGSSDSLLQRCRFTGSSCSCFHISPRSTFFCSVWH